MPTTEQVKLQEITIGNSDFKDVIDSGTLFVDKTVKLADLAKKKKVFFARPRRLGKTMMLSMLEELFSHGAKDNRYFDGLAVQSLWTDTNRYPVINLTLYGHYDPDTFEHDLRKMLHSAFQKVGFTQVVFLDYKNSSLSDLLVDIGVIIDGTDIVFLLDEWDYPLSANLDNFKAYDNNRKVLSVLFRWLRQLRNVRFILITGIGRYEDTSFFTGQDVVDVSMEPLFADLVGYTEDEVKTYFAPHIKAATKLLDCSEDELLGKLKQQYDGFCFDKNAETSLYCTWSVNNFFQQIVAYPNTKPNFTNFWMHNANAPKALRTFLASRKVDLTFLDELKNPGVEIKRGDFDEPTSFERVAFAPLMVQTGYLSIKKVVNPDATDDSSRRYLCYFPNNEVTAVYANVFLRYITNRWCVNGEKWFDVTAQRLHDAMHQQDMATVAHSLNLFLTTIPYDGWVGAKEVIFRTYICWSLLFSHISDRVREETFNFKGRSDVEFEFDDQFYVIELKRLPPKGSKNAAEKLANEAQEQIKDRKYGHNLATWQQIRIKQRYGLILVIAADTRQVCYWRRIELENHEVLGSGWVEALPDPKYKDVESKTTEKTEVIAVEESNAAEKTEVVATEESKAAEQSEEVVDSKNVEPNSVPQIAQQIATTQEDSGQQETPLDISFQIVIDMASEYKSDNLIKIDHTKLVSRMILLYDKLKQKRTEFSLASLSPMVRAVIRDAITENDKKAVKVDFEYLTEQLVLNLRDVIKASLKHRAK